MSLIDNTSRLRNILDKVSSLPDSGGEVLEKKWKLLNEINVEEVVDSVLIDKDSNGNPIATKHMLIHMYLPKYDYNGETATGYTTYLINGENVSPATYSYPSANWDNGHFFFDIMACGEIVYIRCYKSVNVLTMGQPANMFHFTVSSVGEYEYINSFLWRCFNRKVLSGSTFKIYGEV